VTQEESSSNRVCRGCGIDISHRNGKARTCSEKCRQKTRGPRDKEKLKELARKHYLANKDAYLEKAKRWNASERGSHYYQSDRYAMVKKQIHVKRQSRRNPWADAHVRLFYLHRRRQDLKHCAHVALFEEVATAPMQARRYKARMEPWKNPCFDDATKYRIRYRLDLAFRLKEINRQTRRRDVLLARDDGTQNFWLLLRERKTCPYCGARITRDNAVADHMDPVSRGGANGQHNLTICCKSCNAKKQARPFSEWLEMLSETRRRAARLWYVRKHGHAPEAAVSQQFLVFEFASC
jgi:5-methylcytosine-specific restriction endonuclease McrA